MLFSFAIINVLNNVFFPEMDKILESSTVQQHSVAFGFEPAMEVISRHQIILIRTPQTRNVSTSWKVFDQFLPFVEYIFF